MKEWTILEILNWTQDFFSKSNIENPRLQAELIISHVLGLKRLELYMKYDSIVKQHHRDIIKQMIKRRRSAEPLQYILGETNFYGYQFKVDPAVLVPRPETEYLVEKIICNIGDFKSILDIGTGSGCIAVTLAKELPDVNIDAVDISQKALENAARNAALNKAEINFFQSDIFSKIDRKYDLIVSNPPYISESSYLNLPDDVKKYEPEIALLAGKDGLFFYRKILEKAKEHLNANGKIYLEIGCDQKEEIKFIAEKNDFQNIEILKDLNGFYRIMIIG
jgi:release factor glutamine methyltransferase